MIGRIIGPAPALAADTVAAMIIHRSGIDRVGRADCAEIGAEAGLAPAG